jgi:hypothetical protein
MSASTRRLIRAHQVRVGDVVSSADYDRVKIIKSIEHKDGLICVEIISRGRRDSFFKPKTPELVNSVMLHKWAPSDWVSVLR